jgi:hypothetical protein
VTIKGPTVRSRPYAEHTDLSAFEAREMERIYHALGYSDAQMVIAPELHQKAA